MLWFRPSIWDIFKMLWWQMTSPPPKLEPIPLTVKVCPTCRRPL